MVNKKFKVLLVGGTVIFLLVSIFNYDTVQRFFATQDLFRLAILVFLGFLGLSTGPAIIKRLKLFFLSAGHRKPLSEKECRKIVLKHMKDNVIAHGVVNREDINIVGQRFDGTLYDAPYCWMAATTEQHSGSRKLYLNEISYDKLFFVYIDRATGDVSYEPKVNNEKDADELLRDLRTSGLPYDKQRKLTEIEKAIEQEKLRGFAQETGKKLADEGTK